MLKMRKDIIVVSGLPRSGTSLMMKMLDNGGMAVVSDHIRKADIDNPEGYYEFEKVKKIKYDVSWLKDTRGKVFKMISMLLLDLPSTETYKIIFMERNLSEILASQKKMLRRKNIEPEDDDETMGKLLAGHLAKVLQWISEQKNIFHLSVNYNFLVASPEIEIDRVVEFLGVPLNKLKMAQTINPELYRNRAG